MTELLLLLGLLTGVAAAARSTWSPCGLSMLSSITPFGERARGHRYAVTAGWFVLGATIGGATLGATAAGLSAVAAAVGLGRHPAVASSIAAAVAAGTAGVDAGLFGEVLPLLRRQVNDAWLARYRPWVYGAGFGWQIGVGVATYLMTAGVFLLLALAVLSASPLAALTVGAGFGLARGLTVFLTAAAPTPARLRRLHALLDSIGPTVRWVLVGVQAASAVVLVLSAGGTINPLTAGGLSTAAVMVVAGAVLCGAAPFACRRPIGAPAPPGAVGQPAAAPGSDVAVTGTAVGA